MGSECLCGFILECIDPECTIQDSIEKLPKTAIKDLNPGEKWPVNYVETDPDPNKPFNLKDFVKPGRKENL